MVDVQKAAQAAQQEEHEKVYREAALRKQIEYLQKELDAMHPENVSEVRRMELKLEEAGMNETALKEGRKVLNRLKGEGGNSPETGMLTDWLDLLTSLPWKKEKAAEISMETARDALDSGHAGLEKVKNRILQQIAVMRLKGKQSGSILCFIGAPGTGKTSIGESIAKALGRKYVRVSLGGVRDEADIRGHRKTYVGAMPGRIVEAIGRSGSMNPLLVLDEIDKLGSDHRGDPASALLEVLDAEQNHAFRDHYLEIPIDLSRVLFIMTANTTDTIPRPLLDRMELIELPSYTDEEKVQIALRHLLPKQKTEHGVPKAALRLDEDTLRAVIDRYTRESGVRQLERQLAKLCRKTAMALTETGVKRISVTANNLSDYLGVPRYTRDKAAKKDLVGVVNGLAWTQVGGEILPVEVNVMEGTGKLELTGNLGEVMQESCKAALSCLRSRAAELGIDPEFHKTRDIHIHFPEGAVPKDGPSAGVTVTTALLSALTGRAVRHDVAMTGEVTLRGRVMPIGGLREKTMAALRAGLHTVILPKENEKDLEDIDPAVRAKMRFVTAETVDAVFAEALVLPAGTGRSAGLEAYLDPKESVLSPALRV
jgi:ATP-dependent Lon protease